MITALRVATQLIATVIAAELTFGFVHWVEDAYIREDTPLVGKLIGKPNTIHHHFPRYMTGHTWWKSAWVLVILSIILVSSAWFMRMLTWHVWLFTLLAANANEFHKWQHRTRKENGPVISFFQDVHILQSGKHHALHHTDPKNSHYCNITNFLNPILDGVRLWCILEWILKSTLGLKRRPDTSLRGCGPEPDWIAEFSPKKESQTRERFYAKLSEDSN